MSGCGMHTSQVRGSIISTIMAVVRRGSREPPWAVPELMAFLKDAAHEKLKNAGEVLPTRTRTYMYAYSCTHAQLCWCMVRLCAQVWRVARPRWMQPSRLLAGLGSPPSLWARRQKISVVRVRRALSSTEPRPRFV